MKQWLTSPGSSCIECSRLFPFSCSTFSKTSFCYEQALGQRHQSQCQCIRVHHTVIPARMPSMENNMRFSLFITELYLRNRVSDHYVSASSRPTGLRLSHGESMIQLPSLLLNASVLPCLRADVSYFLCCTRKRSLFPRATKETGDVCTQASFALWHEEFDEFSLFVSALSSSLHDFTV